jgi:two-component system response regulator YesN
VESTHYSHGYVCREFKKHVGKTLNEYVSDVKFSYAQAMLLNGETSVASVAEQLNYGSTTNFITAFKKKYGLTPAQWRKDQQ